MKKKFIHKPRLVVTVKNDNGRLKRVMISPLKLKNIRTAAIVNVSLMSCGKFIQVPIKGLNNKEISLKIDEIIHHSPIWPPRVRAKIDNNTIIVKKRTDYE